MAQIEDYINDKQNLSEEEFVNKYLHTKSGVLPVESSYLNNQAQKGFEAFVEEQELKPKEKHSFGSFLLTKLKGGEIGNRINLWNLGEIIKDSGVDDPDFQISNEDLLGYEEFAQILLNCGNQEQVDIVKNQIDELRLDRQIQAERGGLLNFAGDFLNPTSWGLFFGAGFGFKALSSTTNAFTVTGKALSTLEKISRYKLGEGLLSWYGKALIKTVPKNAAFGATLGLAEAITEETTGRLIGGNGLTGKEFLSRITVPMLIGSAFGATAGAVGEKLLSRKINMAAERYLELLQDPKSRSVENITIVIDPEKIGDSSYLYAKVKDSFGHAGLPMSPGVRTITSPSPIVRDISRRLADSFITLVDAHGNVLTNKADTVESLVNKAMAIYGVRIANELNKGFKEWLKEVGFSKLESASIRIKKEVWGNSDKWDIFNAELADAARHKDTYPRQSIEKCAKALRVITDEVTQEAIDAGVYPLQQIALDKLDRLLSGVQQQKNKLESNTKVRIPIGHLNNAKIYKNVSVSAAKHHVENVDLKIAKEQEYRSTLEELLNVTKSSEKDSGALRKLIGKLKDLTSNFEKGIKDLEKKTSASETKNLKQLLKSEDALELHTKAISDALEKLNTSAKEGIKYRELTEIGKLKERLNASNKKLKKLTSEKLRNKELDRQRLLQLQLDFLKAIKTSKKGATVAQGKQLGKLQERYKNTLNVKKEIEDRITKEESAAKKQQAKLEDQFIKDIESIQPKIEELKKNPNATKTQTELNRLIGNIEKRIKDSSKKESGLVKNKEEVSKYIDEGLSKRQGEIDILNKKEEEILKNRKEVAAKRYTVENLKLVGDESYLTRALDKDKIISDLPGFRKALKNGMISMLEQKELFTKPNLTAEEQVVLNQLNAKLENYADSVIRNVQQNYEGRLMDPVHMILRGAENKRILQFSTDYIKDYVINHYADATYRFLQTVVPDSALMRVFKTLDTDELVNAISKDFERLMKLSGDNPRTMSWLENTRQSDIEDIITMFNRVRGTNVLDASNFTNVGRFINNASATIKNLNIGRMLGGTTLAGLNDLGNVGAIFGFKRFYRGSLKYFKDLIKEKTTGGSVLGNEALFNATTIWMQSRQASFGEIIGGSGVLSYTAKWSKGFANAAIYLSGIRAFDHTLKFLVGCITSETILKAGEKLFGGKALSKNDISFLKATGVTENQVRKIYEQFKKHGSINNGLYAPGTANWTNNAVKDLFGAAIMKVQNQAVVTPGIGTVPLFLDHPVLKPFNQFMRFTWTTFEKCMIPAIQRSNFSTFAGAVLMMNVGVLRTLIKMKQGGYDLSDDEILERAIKEMDFLSFYADPYNTVTKLLSFDKEQNSINFNFERAVQGTVLSFVSDASLAASGFANVIFGNGATDSQIHALRKLMFSQNNPLFARFYTQREEYWKSKYGKKKDYR